MSKSYFICKKCHLNCKLVMDTENSTKPNSLLKPRQCVLDLRAEWVEDKGDLSRFNIRPPVAKLIEDIRLHNEDYVIMTLQHTGRSDDFVITSLEKNKIALSTHDKSLSVCGIETELFYDENEAIKMAAKGLSFKEHDPMDLLNSMFTRRRDDRARFS